MLLVEKKIILIRAVQTSMACPAQWNAWDAEGNYYYLRFRHGYGSITQYEDENWVEAGMPEQWHRCMAHFELGSEDDLGSISLKGFAEQSGIELAPDLVSTGFGDHIAYELVMDGIPLRQAEAITQPWRDLEHHEEAEREGQ